MYVRREAVFSSQIEGTRSSLSDLHLFGIEEAPGVPFDDVRELTGKRRHRLFGYDRYLAILNEGTTTPPDEA